jgi:hypothetical protein
MFTVINHVTRGLQSELQIMYKSFTTHCYTLLFPLLHTSMYVCMMF